VGINCTGLPHPEKFWILIFQFLWQPWLQKQPSVRNYRDRTRSEEKRHR